MSAVGVVASQTRYNLLATVRAGSAIALGIVMPVVFYLGASALFGSDAMGGDSPVEVRGAGESPDLRTFYVGGFMAYAVIYAAFVALLPDVVDVRERGLLKRLRGTPLPLSAFVAARFAIAVLITAVGVADDLAVMVIAIVVAVGFMMLAAEWVSDFVNEHPTVKMLALSFLLLIGMSLVAEGAGQHIPKGYIYFAMGFSIFVETLNQKVDPQRPRPVDLRGPRLRRGERTEEG